MVEQLSSQQPLFQSMVASAFMSAGYHYNKRIKAIQQGGLSLWFASGGPCLPERQPELKTHRGWWDKIIERKKNEQVTLTIHPSLAHIRIWCVYRVKKQSPINGM